MHEQRDNLDVDKKEIKAPNFGTRAICTHDVFECMCHHHSNLTCHDDSPKSQYSIGFCLLPFWDLAGGLEDSH